MSPDGNFVELVRIADQIQADLFVAFLGDAEIEFIVQNRMGSGMMGQLMPGSQNPIIIRVCETNIDRAKELLEDYRKAQASSIIPSEMPPEATDKDE